MRKLILTVAIGLLLCMGLTAQETSTYKEEVFTVIEPHVLAFNIDTGNVTVGERFVLHGIAHAASGATLSLRGLFNINLRLSEPLQIRSGTPVTVYLEIVELGYPWNRRAQIVRILID